VLFRVLGVDSVNIVYPVIAAVLWSFNPAVISRYAKNAPPSFFTSIRGLLAALFIGLIIVTNSGFSYDKLPPVILVLIVVSGILGPGLGDIAYTRSIQLIGGSLSIIIGYLYIFLAQLFSLLLFGEELSITGVLGGLVAFMGIVVATYGYRGGSRDLRGILLAFASAVLWGFAASMIKLFRGYVDQYTVSLIRTGSVAVFSAILSALAREKPVVDRGFVIAVFITGVLSWGVGMVLFTYSIYSLGVSATVVATALAPVLSQLTTRLVSGEPYSRRVVAGALLVSLGIVIHAL
jgi:DME family drug/metabolite transporter